VNLADWQAIAEGISGALGQPFEVQSATSVSGGCINEAFRAEGRHGEHFFIKVNQPGLLPMFEAEMAGLQEIVACGAVRAPRPLAVGADSERCWLALEYIDFGSPTHSTSGQLGEQLAAMHRSLSPTYGWHRDNTIGSTPQANSPRLDWIAFLREQRLGFQLQLAAERGAPATVQDSGARLLEAIPTFFSNYTPVPSLLHGDLWGGNWAADSEGRPVIFDPAVYYGDREADLAMTELFGGFDERFYQSYCSCWDIDPGYTTRKVLYNLYHVLNHYNLFGGGYARQAQDMIHELLSNL
jgi:protein-ribulosamine 3-kinase